MVKNYVLDQALSISNFAVIPDNNQGTNRF